MICEMLFCNWDKLRVDFLMVHGDQVSIIADYDFGWQVLLIDIIIVYI